MAQDKAFVTLITNMEYLPGLLTLAHSLRQVGSSYPLIAMYTSTFPAEGLAALKARNIASLKVPSLSPSKGKVYLEDPRFNDNWTKLVVFSLTQFARLVELDSDMVVRRNIDSLMDLPLGDDVVLAAGHACVCNPLRKSHYPPSWTPANCAFTSQHGDPARAQVEGADPARVGLGVLNGGLLVVKPDKTVFAQIQTHMDEHGNDYTFPDQDLLADLYRGRWAPLPYVFNALKTMRAKGVHDAIWRDDQVKVVHFILSPKPWNELDEHGNWTGTNETHTWWIEANSKRLRDEKASGLIEP